MSGLVGGYRRRRVHRRVGRGVVSSIASMLGLGRRIRRRRTLGGYRHRRVLRRGRGFFGDLWSGVKKIGSTALPLVAPYAIKALMGGRRRRVHRRMGGASHSHYIGRRVIRV